MLVVGAVEGSGAGGSSVVLVCVNVLVVVSGFVDGVGLGALERGLEEARPGACLVEIWAP